MKLEDIKVGAKVAGIAPNGSVDIVAVEWIGSQAANGLCHVNGSDRYFPLGFFLRTS